LSLLGKALIAKRALPRIPLRYPLTYPSERWMNWTDGCLATGAFRRGELVLPSGAADGDETRKFQCVSVERSVGIVAEPCFAGYSSVHVQCLLHQKTRRVG